MESRFGFQISPEINCVIFSHVPSLSLGCLTCKTRARARLNDEICWGQQLQALLGVKSLLFQELGYPHSVADTQDEKSST